MAQVKKLRVQTAQVRKFMQTAGITSNAQLARIMGVSEATVSRMMRGRLTISPEIIEGLLRAFPAMEFLDLFEWYLVDESEDADAA